ncbi:cysteine desulfurase-like protein [Allobranchiibius sp. CTAmp26]|uniref:cysteine desulfurase-like protein n=1 Tax=Allobranchiibius sp. CTAmp26 TaxID=2815214 RepID=UPI001AA1D25B|nr:cysteine desulfurase-like protein [Allobranchiibius sp. CTAmp26]MBO1753937.1 cysteine desulfurase-like protein [Allobranchiibius sp. CTAmp26]
MTTTATDLDVSALRAHFPSLRAGTAHFDGPGGSQTPEAVGRAVASTMLSDISNRGVNTDAERNADRVVQECRSALGDLMGVAADTVIFGRSMTALTFEMARTLAATWSPGDEIIVSRLDHDANIRPWVLAAAAAGVTVRWVEFDPATGELDPDAVGALLSSRTRLVAVTAASNLIGTMPDVPAIAALVHAAGALLYVDGVHYAAHSFVDVQALGADFFACSPYKFFGPHCGALTGRADLLAGLHPDKLLPSADQVPERFELGTLPYELMAGTTAALDFIAGVVPGEGTRREALARSAHAMEGHEDRLRGVLEAALSELPGVTIHSRAARRTPTLLVTFAGHDCTRISTHLAGLGVSAPAGSFYAWEASHHLGLGSAGGLRIGLAPYTDENDVDRLVDGITGYLASESPTAG